MFLDYLTGTNTEILNSDSNTECARYSDKTLDKALAQVDDGLKDIHLKYPGMKKTNVNYGLRGTRYYIEFPINGKNVDAFSILIATQSLINESKHKCGAKITSTDSFL